MRIYLDVCCLCRAFDDQSVARIRAETGAVADILSLCQAGVHLWVTSEVVEEEVLRDPDPERLQRVLDVLARSSERLTLSESAIERANDFAIQGLSSFDALHLAVALEGGCDILLTTDDGFVRRSRQLRPRLAIAVENPVAWLEQARES